MVQNTYIRYLKFKQISLHPSQVIHTDFNQEYSFDIVYHFYNTRFVTNILFYKLYDDMTLNIVKYNIMLYKYYKIFKNDFGV